MWLFAVLCCQVSACLEADPERDGDALTGRYFTDRGTAASLALPRRSHGIVGSVEGQTA